MGRSRSFSRSGLVGGAFRLTRADPLRGFWLAVAVAAIALPIGDRSSWIVTLGVSLGGALAW